MKDDREVIFASANGGHGGDPALGGHEQGFKGVGGEAVVLEEGDELGAGERVEIRDVD